MVTGQVISSSPRRYQVRLCRTEEQQRRLRVELLRPFQVASLSSLWRKGGVWWLRLYCRC